MGARLLTARVAGIAGILFVLSATLPGFASGTPPDPGDSAAKFLSYVSSNRSAIILGQVLGVVSVVFAVIFFAKVISALSRVGGYGNPLSVVGVIAIAITGTLACVSGVLQLTAAFRLSGAEHVDAVTVQALLDASAITGAFLGLPFAAFFLSQGLLMRESRIPRWLALAWIVAAPLEAVTPFTALSTTGFFSPEGVAALVFGLLPFGLVVLATSITMLVRPGVFDDETAHHSLATADGSG